MSLPDKNASDILTPAITGTTMLILVQLVSRSFIFAANQMILRNLSPSILGIAAQLDLFLSSILYFSRESIRSAVQRQPLYTPGHSTAADKDGVSSRQSQARRKALAVSSQSIVNMSYLGIGMGIVTATIFSAFYLYFASHEVSKMPYYHMSVAATVIASVVELGSEPFFVVIQQHMLYSKRAAVEICAAFFKSLVTCGISIWGVKFDYNLGPLPFALGYLSYALATFCGYFLVARQQSSDWHFSLFPSRIGPSDDSTYLCGRFPWRLITLSANVFLQSVIKHLLTQGDSMILAAMTSLQEQGIYSLASNYGGLLARVLFQPIEENSRAIFSSLLNSKAGNGQEANITSAKAHLVSVARGYMMITALVIPLGPAFAPKLLHILGGRRWIVPEVDGLFALYCYYIPFLAFNGIGEAFVSSTAKPSELRKQSAYMALFSACFALAAYLFLSMGGLGARGLVYVNIVNMCVRIIWSFSFIRKHLRRYKMDIFWVDFAPRVPTNVAGATVAVLLSNTELRENAHGELISLALAVFYVLLVYVNQRVGLTSANMKHLQALFRERLYHVLLRQGPPNFEMQNEV